MKLIGKLAIVAASLTVSGISAAVVAVKKTEKGAEIWNKTCAATTKANDAVTKYATEQTEKCEAKLDTLKKDAEKKGEQKAIFAEVAKDEDLYETMKMLLSERLAAKKAAEAKK